MEKFSWGIHLPMWHYWINGSFCDFYLHYWASSKGCIHYSLVVFFVFKKRLFGASCVVGTVSGPESVTVSKLASVRMEINISQLQRLQGVGSLVTVTLWGNGRGKVRPKQRVTPKLQQLHVSPTHHNSHCPTQGTSSKTMLRKQTQFRDTFSGHPFQTGPYSNSPPTNKEFLIFTRSVCVLIRKLVPQVCSVCENSSSYRPMMCSLFCMKIKLQEKVFLKIRLLPLQGTSSQGIFYRKFFILQEFISLILNATSVIPLSSFLIAIKNN